MKEIKLKMRLNPPYGRNLNDGLEYLAKKQFNGWNIDLREFFYDLADHLSEEGFPCDALTICPCTGYYGRFTIILSFESKTIAGFYVKVLENKLFGIDFYGGKDYEPYEMFHHIVKEYFEELNIDKYEEMLSRCNVKEFGTDNEIVIVHYKDYKETSETKTLKGTLKEMFKDYYNINDHLKYINGEYWRFVNEDFKKLYSMFLEMRDKNFGLHCCLERGCIID